MASNGSDLVCIKFIVNKQRKAVKIFEIQNLMYKVRISEKQKNIQVITIAHWINRYMLWKLWCVHIFPQQILRACFLSINCHL